MKRVLEVVISFVMIMIVSGGALLAIMAAMLQSPAGLIALVGATILVMSMCGVLACVVGVWLWNWISTATADHARRAEFIHPNENGRFPIPVAALRTGAGVAAAFDLNKASFFSSMTHYHNQPTVNGADPAALQMSVATNAPMSFSQLYSAGQLPTTGFLMGYDVATNEPVTADWKKLYSALIGGQSGSGKSTLIRSILAQAALQGGKFVVVDPHFGAGDESLGASLKPLQGRMMGAIAHDDKTMTTALEMIKRIGERRIAGIDKSKSPIILIVDELTALLQRSNIAPLLSDVLGQISQETRKVGVFALCIGQNFDGRIMDTTVRNSFVSFVSCRARRDVARTMTGNPEFGKMANDLTIGQAVWMTPGGEVVTLQVPNCTTADVEMVAGRGFSVVEPNPLPTPVPTRFQGASKALPAGEPGASFDDSEVVGKRVGSGSEAHDGRAELVRNLVRMGYSQKAIIKEVWSVDGGRNYQPAQEELTQILATLV